jgi:hypothetical protein
VQAPFALPTRRTVARSRSSAALIARLLAGAIAASPIRGTFTATLAPATGTTSPLSVTNGVFDVGR